MQSKISIKLQLDEDIRRVPATSQLSFTELHALAQTLFHFEKTKEFTFKYTDDEGDLCTVSSNEELAEAFRFAPAQVLRLSVSVLPPKPVEQPEKPEKSAPARPVRTCATWPTKGQKIRDSHALQNKALEIMTTDTAAAQAIFREQFQICRPWQKATCLYNLACCDSLLGNTGPALALLSRAIEAGFTNVAHIQADTDLDNIRHTAAFQLLLAGILEKEPVGHPQKLFALACYHSLMGNSDLAIASLEKAVQAGFGRINMMLDSTDLNSIHDHPKWASIVEAVIQNKAKNQAKPRGGKCGRHQRVVPAPQEEPKIGVPVVEEPKVEEPVVEEPKVEEPVVLEEAHPFVPQTSLEVLQEMGFVDRPRNILALMMSGGDVQKAIMRLLS